MAAILAILMTVAWGCSEPLTGSAEDTALKQSVAAKLEAANIPGIAVNVQDGVVTLAGPAADQATADRALELARSTSGVKSVVNQLAVASAPPTNAEPVTTPDEVLKARVDLKLASDAALAGSKITPNVAAGVVTLGGTVPTDAAKAAAEAAAKSVAGVTSVVNNLQVVAVAVEVVPDPKITDDVNALLDKQFFELIVNVEVKGGVVTLSGAVPNRGTIVQVTKAVREIKGVKSVDTSRLTVQGGEPENERIGSPTKKG
jgi:hyperosmotically inducible protein